MLSFICFFRVFFISLNGGHGIGIFSEDGHFLQALTGGLEVGDVLQFFLGG